MQKARDTKPGWDYTDLAAAYVKRPDYAGQAIDEVLAKADLHQGARVCDVGAGAGHLTLELAKRGLTVVAVEPNAAMRAKGIERTSGFPDVAWHEGTGEHTGQAAGDFDLVTFGSSFNVTDRPIALRETARILKPPGWFACLWNHRDLDDPIQHDIEEAIRSCIPGYDYGSRREDQTSVIEASGLFGAVHRIDGHVRHEQRVDDCLEAWRSHATLHRQAAERFDEVIDAIGQILAKTHRSAIDVPYTTRVWMAQRER